MHTICFSLIVYLQAEASGASEMATMLADKLGDLTPDPDLGQPWKVF